MSTTYPRSYYRARARILANATQCSYCGCDISVDLPMGHPQRATIDHRVPISRGGTHDEHNLVPCCARDNSRKKNRAASVLLPPVTRSRDWLG
jgi:5-methylcytosine-specific restriction endonuclease McrA